MNKIMLLGNIGNAPELQDKGTFKLLNFSLATQRTLKKGDKYEKETDWHNCTAFGHTAEAISKYCQKGSKILVEGEMTYPSWEKDGVKVSKPQVKVQSFEFAGEKTASTSGSTSSQKLENDGISIEQIPW